jgi:hypothetical protein
MLVSGRRELVPQPTLIAIAATNQPEASRRRYRRRQLSTGGKSHRRRNHGMKEFQLFG